MPCCRGSMVLSKEAIIETINGETLSDQINTLLAFFNREGMTIKEIIFDGSKEKFSIERDGAYGKVKFSNIGELNG